MYDWENSETREGLYKGMAHGIENLAVDWVTGNVYWTDSDYKWIMVADKVIQKFTKKLARVSKIIFSHEFQKLLFGAKFENSFLAQILKTHFFAQIIKQLIFSGFQPLQRRLQSRRRSKRSSLRPRNSFNQTIHFLVDLQNNGRKNSSRRFNGGRNGRDKVQNYNFISDRS